MQGNIKNSGLLRLVAFLATFFAMYTFSMIQSPSQREMGRRAIKAYVSEKGLQKPKEEGFLAAIKRWWYGKEEVKLQGLERTKPQTLESFMQKHKQELEEAFIVPNEELLKLNSEQLKKSINRVSQDSLIALYKNGSSGPGDQAYLYISPQNLINVDGIQDLKDLFNRNGLYADSWSGNPWSDSDWESCLSKLKTIDEKLSQLKRNEIKKNIIYYYYYEDGKHTLDELVALLVEAKKVLKFFLTADDSIQKYFVKKNGINRLFTYARLQQVISEKKLTHVRLPLKFILIHDNTTRKYITKENAASVIDDLLKICVMKDLSSTIEFVSDRYTIDIFATKEEKRGKGFSKATMKELFALCKEAPFDIGYDNIFWDVKGDAIIIDTEHKNENEKNDCDKLNRYPLDPEL